MANESPVTIKELHTLSGVDTTQSISDQIGDEAITAKLLTGLATGSASAIADTDTILEALAKLQAQIDAL